MKVVVFLSSFSVWLCHETQLTNTMIKMSRLSMATLVTWSYGHKVKRALCVRMFSAANLVSVNAKRAMNTMLIKFVTWSQESPVCEGVLCWTLLIKLATWSNGHKVMKEPCVCGCFLLQTSQLPTMKYEHHDVKIGHMVKWSQGHENPVCVRVFSAASIAIANSRLSLHLYSSLWSASCITPLLQTQYDPFAKVSIDCLPPRVSHFTGCFF